MFLVADAGIMASARAGRKPLAPVKGAEVVMAERTTFYGAREIGIKDPGGHYLTFAQFTAPPQH